VTLNRGKGAKQASPQMIETGTTMATTDTVPQKNGILQLWYNKEARSVIVQVVTMALIFAFFAYIIRNAVVNMEAIGKGFSFEFLFQPASYDINQHLIDYNSRDPHWKAALVGIINTALIAFFGVILATVLGFILGVLRLSKNFLANRIVYFYIEYVRNVPVLIHILMIHAVIVHTLPKPKQSIGFSDTYFLNNRGFYMPDPTFQTGMWFVGLTLLAGIVFAVYYYKRAKIKQQNTGQTSPVFWVSIASIIGAPVVMFFLTGMPIEWTIPELKGFNFKGGMALKPEFLALWLALSLYTAAFIAEIVRAGILAVPWGQTEAAGALGLRNNRTLQLIVIPQALRVIVPPLTSQYLNLTKNSSLAIAIGYMDIVATIGGITLNQTGREMECMMIVLALYLCFSLLISMGMNLYNNSIKLVER